MELGIIAAAQAWYPLQRCSNPSRRMHFRPRMAARMMFMMIPRMGRGGRRFPEVSAQAVDKGLICCDCSARFEDALFEN